MVRTVFVAALLLLLLQLAAPAAASCTGNSTNQSAPCSNCNQTAACINSYAQCIGAGNTSCDCDQQLVKCYEACNGSHTPSSQTGCSTETACLAGYQSCISTGGTGCDATLTNCLAGQSTVGCASTTCMETYQTCLNSSTPDCQCDENYFKCLSGNCTDSLGEACMMGLDACRASGIAECICNDNFLTCLAGNGGGSSSGEDQCVNSFLTCVQSGSPCSCGDTYVQCISGLQKSANDSCTGTYLSCLASDSPCNCTEGFLQCLRGPVSQSGCNYAQCVEIYSTCRATRPDCECYPELLVCMESGANASSTPVCTTGQYLDVGLQACISCPMYSTSIAGSVGAESCLCLKGYTTLTVGHTMSCEPCPANTFKAFDGSQACTPCQPGTHHDQVGAVDPMACTLCPENGTSHLPNCVDRCFGLEVVEGVEGTITFHGPVSARACKWLFSPGWVYPGNSDLVESSRGHCTVFPPQIKQQRNVTNGTLNYSMTSTTSGMTFPVTTPPGTTPMDQNGTNSSNMNMHSDLPTDQGQYTLSAGNQNISIQCGEPADRVEHQYVASVMQLMHSSMVLRCQGALIDRKWVLTSASCIMEGGHVLGGLKVTLGTPGTEQEGCQPEQHEVVRAFVHPAFSVEMSHDVALLELGGASDFTPVGLYTGSDLAPRKCGAPQEIRYMEIGWAVGAAGESQLRQKMLGGMQCMMDGQHAVPNMQVRDDTLCAVDMTTSYPAVGCFCSSGTPLLVEDPSTGKHVLAGLNVLGTGCQLQNMAGVYVRISEVYGWVLSVAKLGNVAPLKLQLSFSQSSLPNGTAVKTYSRGAEHPSIQTGIVDMTNYQLGITDEGAGSAMVTLDVASQDAGLELASLGELKISYKWLSCGQNFELQQIKNNESCAGADRGIVGCRFELVGGEAMCLDPVCEVHQGTSELIEYLNQGKAWMGGLAGLSEKTNVVNYNTWMCLRDWDSREQPKCGIRPGEVACFRYESNSKSWDYYGRNGIVNFVSSREEVVGRELEVGSLLLPP